MTIRKASRSSRMPALHVGLPGVHVENDRCGPRAVEGLKGLGAKDLRP